MSDKDEIKVCRITPRSQIKDFNSLPFPDRTLIDCEKYSRYIGMTMVKHVVSIQATRGCPYSCAYCHKIWPKYHVVRTAENIFKEVELYYKIGIRRFAFIDDIFNLNVENSRRFFKLVIESGIKIQIFFPNGLRGDILTKEYIDLMVRAGVVSFALALETASPRLQKLIGKNLNLEKLRANIEYITMQYPQVILELFTMHGFPTETEEEAKMTLDFIKSIKWLHFPYFHLLKIYPGSDMAKLAMENNIPEDAIERSIGLAYHELPETLPFPKQFTLQCQSELLFTYFMSKERLLKVLPIQMQVLTENELVQKYNSYLPVEIKSFNDLLKFIAIPREQLGKVDFVSNDYGAVHQLNEKLKQCFSVKVYDADALKFLLLDLSQYFSTEINKMLYDVVEQPLGLMCLLTYLNERFGSKIHGQIAKSRIDFDSFDELRLLIEEFKPDVIGIRALTFHRDFFHQTAAAIRQWGVDVPIIAGGPYATSSYREILRDCNIDLVVLGEGEITLSEIAAKMIGNGRRLPGTEILKDIAGVAFVEDCNREIKL